MRALVIADAFFSIRERPLLSRLEIGLADEGVGVVHAVPERSSSASAGDVYAQVVRFDDFALGFGLRGKAAKIAGAVAGLSEDSAPIDVVHVFGGSMWRLGRALAREFDAGLVLEVWRSGLVERAPGLCGTAGSEVLFLAPDPAIERALLAEGPAITARLAMWGVHAAPSPRDASPHLAPAAVVIGTGRDRRAFSAAFGGLANAVRARPEFQIVADARAVQRSGVWTQARRAGLLGNLSLIDDIESRRDLIAEADLLVVPESLGEQRSVVLDAMGAGMAVVAAPDPAVSALIDGRTARLVRAPTPEAWSHGVVPLVTDLRHARVLGESARAYVRESRTVSGYVRAVIDAYRWLRRTDSIPFGRAG